MTALKALTNQPATNGLTFPPLSHDRPSDNEEKSIFAHALIDNELTVLSNTPAFTQMTGMDTVVGRYLPDIFPDLQKNEANLPTSLANQATPYLTQICRPLSDKSARSFNLHVEPLAGFDKLWLVQLINNSDGVSEELRQPNIYHTIFETSPDALLVIDPASQAILDVNPAACELYGYSQQEMRHLEATRLTTDSHLWLTRTQETSTQIFEQSHQRKDGSTFYVEISFSRFSYQEHQLILCTHRDITNRQQAEQKLKKREANYRAIIQDQTELISRYMPDGTINFVNQAYCRFFNKTAAELIGHRFSPLIPVEDQAIVDQAIQNLSVDNPTMTIEHRVIQDNGKIRWQQWTNRLIVDEAGEIVEIQAVGRDITDHKRAEEALKIAYEELESYQGELEMQNSELKRTSAQLELSRRDYQNLYDFAPVSYFTFDQKGVIVKVNLTAANLLDIERKRLLNKPFIVYVMPEYHGKFYQHCYQVLQTGKNQTCEIQLRLADKMIDVQLHSEIERDHEGQSNFIRTVLFDVTIRKQAEMALRQSEERFRTVADFTYDWEYWIDRQGNYLYISPSCERITGYKPIDFLEDTTLLAKITHPDDKNIILHHLDEHVLKKEVYTMQFRLITREGSQKWIGHICQPVYNTQGEFLGRRGSNRDITEQKQAAETLKRSQQFLHNVLNHIPDPLFVKDESHQWTMINDAFAEITGVSKEELIGKSDNDFFPPEEANAAWFEDELAFRTAVSKKHERIFTTVAGSQRMVSTKKAVFEDEAGRKVLVGVMRDITERKQAEEKLQEQKRFIESIADASPNILYVYNIFEDQMIYANSEFGKILGYTPAEVVAMGSRFIPTVMHPVDLVRSSEHFNRLERAGHNEVIEREYQMQHKNGEWRWLLGREVVFKRTIDGKIREILGTAQDITDRRLAEEALRKSEANMRAILNNSLQSFLLIDRDYRILAFNNIAQKRTELIFGKPLAEGDSIYSFVLDKDRFDFDQNFQAALKGQTIVLEKAFTNDSDQKLWFEFNYIPATTDDGEIIGACLTSLDITRRKQADEELRNLSKVFQNSADPIIIENITGQVSNMNDEAVRAYGWERQELLGQSIEFIIPPAHRPQMEQLRGQCREGKNIRNVEAVRWNKAGEALTVLLTLSLLTDEYNQPIGIATIAKDITELKQVEMELQQAKEAAETANKAKSVFLASMSHELRTPLNSILGFAQILQKDANLTSLHQEAITTIRRSGDHLLMLINDILDLSKIEAGRMELRLTTFNLAHFLQNIVEMFQLRAKQKGLAFHYELLAQGPTNVQAVEADERQLRQILLNLLSNALKFTEKGNVTLAVNQLGTFTLPPSPDEDDPNQPPKTVHTIRFEVIDTGLGIPQNKLAEIFEPFRQISENTYFTEGTGLGLAISKRQAELMGSQLHVESIVGQGSRFWFDLDLPESLLMPEVTAPDQVIVGFQGEVKKILVIDDKAENRAVLKTALSDLDFTIFEAVDGLDGLAKAKAHQPDLILVDLRMPNMDGLEMTRRLRQSAAGKKCVIIAVSASAFADSREKSLAAGCDNFITKPIDIPHLLTLIGQQLHLAWVYHSDNQFAQSKEGTTMMAPPAEELALLQTLARRGDIRGILNQLDQLDYRNKQFYPFTAELRQLAKGYQIKQIKLFIKKHQERNYG